MLCPGGGLPRLWWGVYDELLAKFGFPCPATGFALTIDRVLDALDKQSPSYDDQIPDYFITGSDMGEVVKKQGN